ncbi:hypothetical protein LBMAG48_13590 [Phycisphaerae bacterium]|jgi:hypothetical protein|nr:hypothetical protein LBMAG48_13590 [Phycisphaerae bacterium]
MAKASDLRNKLGASGTSPMAPKKNIFQVEAGSDVGMPTEEHPQGKPGSSGPGQAPAPKAVKPLGGAGGGSSRPKV